jgi:hypothetical protein
MNLDCSDAPKLISAQAERAEAAEKITIVVSQRSFDSHQPKDNKSVYKGDVTPLFSTEFWLTPKTPFSTKFLATRQ